VIVRARTEALTDRRHAPVIVEEAPVLVVDAASPALRRTRVTAFVFEYQRVMRGSWELVCVEAIGTYMFERDGVLVNTELTARDTFHAEDDTYHRFALSDLPAWVHAMARTWLPTATGVPLSHNDEGAA
jgi:hypothetical protein